MPEGYYLSARLGRDESYRLSQDDGGYWVVRDALGHSIGDNIALVRDVCGPLVFTDAVYQLRSAAAHAGLTTTPLTPRLAPRIPACTQADIEAGRSYLDGLGISSKVIEVAERAGFLRYTAGAVLFCGIDDQGVVRNASRCAISDADSAPTRYLSGADQRFALVLQGRATSRTVCLVEGGIDALVLQTTADHTSPHVIATGGGAILGWSDDPRVKGLLCGADRVFVACRRGNVPDSKKAAYLERQAALVREHSGREPEVWCPTFDNDSNMEVALSQGWFGAETQEPEQEQEKAWERGPGR